MSSASLMIWEWYVPLGLVAFGVSLLVTVLLTPVVARWASKLGVVDTPGGRRMHANVTPRGGGVALFAGFHLSCFAVFSLCPSLGYLGTIDLGWWQYFLAASLLLLLVGVVDDIREIRALTKLAGQILVATMMYLAGVHVDLQPLGIISPLLSYFLTVIWFVAIINAFNLIDGLDGLASGLAIVAALGIGATCVYRGLPGETLLMISLIGASLGFLRHNYHPAVVFLGDSGSMFLGLAFASVTLSASTRGSGFLAWGLPILALSIPILDASLAIWRRFARRVLSYLLGRSSDGGVMSADMDHLHHRLVKLGFGTKSVAGILYGANAALVLAGILCAWSYSYSAAVFMITVMLIVYLAFRFVLGIELWTSGLVLVHVLKSRYKPILAFVLSSFLELLGLSFAFLVAVVFTASSEQTLPDLLGQWALAMPRWVGIPFLALFSMEVHRWLVKEGHPYSRVIRLTCGVIGYAVLLGCLLMLSTNDVQKPGTRTLWFFAIAYAYIGVVRMAPQLVELLMLRSLSGKDQGRASSRNVLVYRGERDCQLVVLNDVSLDAGVDLGLAASSAQTLIALEDKDLRGYDLDGSLDNMGKILATYQVRGVIVSGDLETSVLRELLRIAKEQEVNVMEWSDIR